MTSVDDLIAAAAREIGKPYVYGDEGPNAFDCSGLMQYVYAQVGIKLPRTAHEQQRYASPVKNPLPGDLVFWGDPAYHVALYVGNGKMISAPHKGSKVGVSDVYGTPTYGRVPGLGALLAVPFGLARAAGDSVSGLVDRALGNVKTIVYEGLFVALGLGLLGWGVYKASGADLKNALRKVTPGGML